VDDGAAPGAEPGLDRRVTRPGDSLAALIARYERAHAALARRARDEDRLEETFVDPAGWTQTRGGTILHVVLHDAQHRGEVLHHLERLGVPDLPEGDPQEWEHATGII
jgi:uncharacterized damage-inducible protein DinB